MNTSERLPTDHPQYEARLRAQHGLVAAPGNIPIGLVGGLLMGLPAAASIDGFPIGLLTAGVPSVLLAIGIGLLILATIQGLPRLMSGFWNMRHSLEELHDDQRLVWYTYLAGLFFTGLGLGFALAFLLR